MKFNRDELTAQGVEMGGQSIYLTGFSYATILAACELAGRRYMWDEMDATEWDELDAQLSQMMLEVQRNALLGTVVPFMGDVIPQYLLLCDGGVYQREDYPALYAILPASLILDADTFTLPDMAGLYVSGATIAQPLLSSFGEAEVTLTEAQLARHAHYYTPPVNNIDLEDVGVPELGASAGLLPTLTDYAGGDEPHNNLPPSISLYYCVVAR